jgi:hypothetical protein
MREAKATSCGPPNLPEMKSAKSCVESSKGGAVVVVAEDDKVAPNSIPETKRR